MPSEHSDIVKVVLAFEREWLNRRQDSGAKLTAVRETFGLSTTRYYQLVRQVVDSVEALQEDPVTTRILQRRRAAQHPRRWSRVTMSA
ncbi:DUF3263 domain-containing protein [Oryzobacter sp. R7]|uniref:DUF3263 domain-containing protein n=1 Tax=Oryzobacter faecalis TaxID=3388656 RepID=UPI00398CEAE0